MRRSLAKTVFMAALLLGSAVHADEGRAQRPEPWPTTTEIAGYSVYFGQYKIGIQRRFDKIVHSERSLILRDKDGYLGFSLENMQSASVPMKGAPDFFSWGRAVFLRGHEQMGIASEELNSVRDFYFSENNITVFERGDEYAVMIFPKNARPGNIFVFNAKNKSAMLNLTYTGLSRSETVAVLASISN